MLTQLSLITEIARKDRRCKLKSLIRYIVRFLKSGVMEEGNLHMSEKGTPQGGVISPILANIYLHYVLDIWIARIVKKHCRGTVEVVRYADDFVKYTMTSTLWGLTSEQY